MKKAQNKEILILLSVAPSAQKRCHRKFIKNPFRTSALVAFYRSSSSTSFSKASASIQIGFHNLLSAVAFFFCSQNSTAPWHLCFSLTVCLGLSFTLKPVCPVCFWLSHSSTGSIQVNNQKSSPGPFLWEMNPWILLLHFYLSRILASLKHAQRPDWFHDHSACQCELMGVWGGRKWPAMVSSNVLSGPHDAHWHPFPRFGKQGGQESVNCLGRLKESHRPVTSVWLWGNVEQKYVHHLFRSVSEMGLMSTPVCGLKAQFWSQAAQVRISTMPLANCATITMLLNLIFFFFCL